MSVLGEGRVIGHCILEAETTEPSICKIQLNFFAQTTLGADAVAIPNDQHPDHKFGVNGRTARMAVVLRQVLVEVLQIQTAIDGSKKMGRRNDVFKVESVEQPLLPARLMTHHVGALRTRWRFANSARRPRRPRVFQQNRPVATVQ
ncbi:hypothetical protein D3C85_968670 [compost metagenome]